MGLFINGVIIFGGIVTPLPLVITCHFFAIVDGHGQARCTVVFSSGPKVARLCLCPQIQKWQLLAQAVTVRPRVSNKYRAAWTAKKEHLQENISDVSSKILAIFWCKYVTKRKNPATLEANNNVRGELFWQYNAMLHLQISRLSATLVQQLAKCENCKGGETGRVRIQPVLQDLAADKCLCSPVNHTLITANCYSERT